MRRRNFLASAAAFFVAPRLDPTVLLSATETVAPSVGTVAPTAVLTNAKLDEIYAILVGETAKVWTERYRAAYIQLINTGIHEPQSH